MRVTTSFMQSAILASLLASCASNPAESPDKQCERMRDHLIDLNLADAVEVDRGAHAAAMRSAFGTEFTARCVDTLSETQRDCVIRAVDSAAASACASTNR